jgi:hypothetical protein
MIHIIVDLEVLLHIGGGDDVVIDSVHVGGDENFARRKGGYMNLFALIFKLTPLKT